MGKILKFCSSCEEGFAEKFSFCPNCANELAAFEMKPVADKASSNEVEKTIEDIPEEVQSVAETVEDIPVVASAETVEDIPAVVDSEIETAYETKPLDEETIFEPIAFESDPAEIAVSEDVTEIEVEEPAEEETNEYAAAAPIIADESYASTQSESDSFEEATDVEVEAEQTDYSYRFEDETLDDNDYGVTVIEDSGNKMRSSLLLGASVLVLTIAIGGLGYSLFNHPLFMAAIDGDVSLLAPVDIGPVEIEEKKPEPKKNDEEDSGGGGGGNERKKPPSRGELPSQTRDKIPPIMPVKRMDNPSLVVINKTDGDIKRKRNDRIGLPKGMSGDISSGTGTGGGFGTGKGKGVGSGIGTGEGSGIGSGSGNGNGNGTGNGTGRGGNRKPPPTRPKGPTVGLKIRVKPRATYTDKARQNNVQGKVMLRVTFLASGRIGSISPINRLPHGLTAKAIAAARRIKFTPKMVNGVPRSVTKRIQYNFTIY